MLIKRTIAFVILFLALSIQDISAQTSGVIRYQETVKLDVDLPPELESMRDQIPSSQQNESDLFFNERASLMRSVEEEDQSEEAPPTSFEHSDGGMMVNFRMRRSDQQTFVDFENGKTLEKQDLLGRDFRVEGDLERRKWKIDSNQVSDFLGFMCQKATLQMDSTSVEAWFTTEIPVPVGPSSFNGLPGAILVLTIDDGQRTFQATNVSLGPVEDSVLVPPSKGKKVSKEEYKKIADEKMKEMNMSRNGSGANIIRVVRN